jgi:hypothetical protein
MAVILAIACGASGALLGRSAVLTKLTILGYRDVVPAADRSSVCSGADVGEGWV